MIIRECGVSGNLLGHAAFFFTKLFPIKFIFKGMFEICGDSKAKTAIIHRERASEYCRKIPEQSESSLVSRHSPQEEALFYAHEKFCPITYELNATSLAKVGTQKTKTDGLY